MRMQSKVFGERVNGCAYLHAARRAAVCVLGAHSRADFLVFSLRSRHSYSLPSVGAGGLCAYSLSLRLWFSLRSPSSSRNRARNRGSLCTHCVFAFSALAALAQPGP
jgi:hypothetical protein